GAFVVDPYQAAVAGYIRHQDCHKSAFYFLTGHSYQLCRRLNAFYAEPSTAATTFSDHRQGISFPAVLGGLERRLSFPVGTDTNVVATNSQLTSRLRRRSYCSPPLPMRSVKGTSLAAPRESVCGTTRKPLGSAPSVTAIAGTEI